MKDFLFNFSTRIVPPSINPYTRNNSLSRINQNNQTTDSANNDNGITDSNCNNMCPDNVRNTNTFNFNMNRNNCSRSCYPDDSDVCTYINCIDQMFNGFFDKRWI